MITLTRVGEANAGLFVYTIERQGAEPERWLTRAETVNRLIALGVEDPEPLVATAAERGKVVIHEHQ